MKLRFCPTILLLSLACIGLSTQNAIAVSKETVEALAHLAKLGKNVYDLEQTISKNPNDKQEAIKAVITVLDTLGATIPYVGPFCTILAKILGNVLGGSQVKSELSVVLDHLKEMNGRFDQLGQKLDAVMRKIESTSTIAHYKSKFEAIVSLKIVYKRFIDNPTGETREDVQRTCRENKMLDFIHWVDAEVNGNSIMPMRKVMLEEYDMATLTFWADQITVAMSNAMFLHSACVGLSGHDEKTIHDTLQGPHGDIAVLQGVIHNVKRGINTGAKQIRRSFFAHAHSEIDGFLRDHQHASHEDFVNQVYNHLRGKYSWRDWIVAAWNADTTGFGAHTVTAGERSGWFWKRVHDRDLLVGSVLPGGKQGDQFRSCFDSHVARYDTHHGAQGLHTSIKNDCLKGGLEALAVVKFGHGLRVKYTAPSALTFKNDEKDGGNKFSVIAVPNDPTTWNNGDECNADGIYCPQANMHCCWNSGSRIYQCCSD